MNSVFHMGAQVICILTATTKGSVQNEKQTLSMNRSQFSSRSNLGPMGIAIHSVALGFHQFDHKFMVCKNLFCLIICNTNNL